MLKNQNPKFTKGSLFVCSKCGKDFSEPVPDRAEKLKTDLRAELKPLNAHTKVRVMVAGCLGVCNKDEQTFAYYPNCGEMEMFTTSTNFDAAKSDILKVIKTKI
jgi:predicted metal-binding protein